MQPTAQQKAQQLAKETREANQKAQQLIVCSYTDAHTAPAALAACMKVIDLLLNFGFDIVVLLVGLQAGGKLFTTLSSRPNVLVTTTYHTVPASSGARHLNMVVDIEQSLHNQVAHEDQRDAACVKLAEVHLFSPGRVLMHWVRGGARRRRWCWRRTTCKDSHGGEQRCTEHEPGPWL